jgi:predicted DCC family thiol-disulfide oxidoreductase YuxK
MGKWRFYYDGNCGFCATVVALLSRTDWRGAVAWVPFQCMAGLPPGLTGADLDGAAYLETGQSALHRGFFAFRMLSLRLPSLFILAPILWCPGVSWLGVAVYGWVARNRYLISRCPMPKLKPFRDRR